jgi:hypothetical protein
MSDQALVFLDDRYGTSQRPGTHVFVIGVGHYVFGKRGASGRKNTIISDLNQLTSPPISVRAIVDWFTQSFHSPERPLASVSLLISDAEPTPYLCKPRPGVTNKARPNPAEVRAPLVADLRAAKIAAERWAARCQANRDNMAVFYFCGHGISQGEQAALMLCDFGHPDRAFDGAIDVNVLLGAMKNCSAVKQLFFFDCCRTAADELYKNQPNIGSRLLSLPIHARDHSEREQQFVLYPTLDGEEAFGIKNETSVFTRSIIDALSFAAADFDKGKWLVNTGRILTSVERLTASRVPASHMNRTRPNSPNATPFDVNEIEDLTAVRSYVTLSDPSHWERVVQLECVEPTAGGCQHRIDARAISGQRYGRFDVNEGRWRFGAAFEDNNPSIKVCERHVRLPVAFVTLEVEP